MWINLARRLLVTDKVCNELISRKEGQGGKLDECGHPAEFSWNGGRMVDYPFTNEPPAQWRCWAHVKTAWEQDSRYILTEIWREQDLHRFTNN